MIVIISLAKKQNDTMHFRNGSNNFSLQQIQLRRNHRKCRSHDNDGDDGIERAGMERFGTRDIPVTGRIQITEPERVRRRAHLHAAVSVSMVPHVVLRLSCACYARCHRYVRGESRLAQQLYATVSGL